MKDNSDIPLPLDQLRSRVLVFAITDEATHEYEEITKGYVELSTDEDGKSHTFHYLQVKDQQTNQVLMRSNLKLQNNFGKQKGSIISWTDNQQPQYQEIALSFEKDRQCDMFWRTICQKINKNYLQINGMQKLQPPTASNLNFILEKAKNSIDLMDYNIVHSSKVIEGLREMFYEMKRTGDEFGMGTIWRIVNAILSPAYSSNAIQTLLTRDNFYLVLDLQQYRKNIPFRSIYEQKVGQYLNNKFLLPKQVYEKIQLSHRAVFYRQNVLELSEDGLLESLMFVIAKQAQVEILSFLNRTRFLDTLVAYKEYPRETRIEDERHINYEGEPKIQENPQLTNDKLHFLHQAIHLHNLVTGEQLKQTFKENLYTSSIFPFLKSQIDLLNPKSLEIIISIAEMDKLKFFEYMIENFRQNSAENLLKSIMKVYLNSNEMRSGVAVLIEALVPLFNLKKELLDFFIGTFVCSVLAVAKDMRAILILCNILLLNLQNSSIMYTQLLKLKICQKLSTQYRTGTTLTSKPAQLQMMKFLKYILIEQNHKGTSKNQEIQKNLISTGLLQCCMMIYTKHSLKYNVISSSMLENLKLIQRMDCSEIHEFLVKEYTNNEQFSSNEIIKKILSSIKIKYFQFLNQKISSANQQQQYLEMQRMVHEQILQNQHQDTYLMNQDYEEPGIIQKNIDQTNQKPQQLSSNPNGQDYSNTTISENIKPKITSNDIQQPSPQIKQDPLQFLKRMMDEIKQDDEETLSREPRKIVKRSQESKQTAIQFCFDLPDMDDLMPEQLKGT